MRLHEIAPEYDGRVRLVGKAFPLEVYGGGPPKREILEAEIWLAALQEPKALFKPFGSDWPTTTLPAFEAAWCVKQQGDAIGREFDLRIRHAFFAEGRDIGQRQVMLELADEAGVDMEHFTRLFNNGAARAAVLEEGRLGKEVYHVHGTPTVMLSDGRKLRHPIAYPNMREGKIVAVGQLPCCGEGCYEATRQLFENVLKHEPKKDMPE